MNLSVAFYQWFLAELLQALRGLDFDESEPAEASTVLGLTPAGHTSLNERIIVTPRQSLFMPRPQQTLYSVSVDGVEYALGDGARAAPPVFLGRRRGMPFAVTEVEFADFLIPPGPLQFAAERAFSRSGSSYPDTPLPSGPDGESGAWPAFHVELTPEGAYRMPFEAPAAFGAGLSFSPIHAYQQHFYDVPGDGHPHFGLFPSGAHRVGWFGPDNDWYTNFDATVVRPRPNVLWPYMTGVDAGGAFVRVPRAVASATEFDFTYRRGYGQWTFPAKAFSLEVLYLNLHDWGTVLEKPYPYAPAALPGPLTSPPDIEDWFKGSPFVTATYEDISGPGEDPSYLLTPAFSLDIATETNLGGVRVGVGGVGTTTEQMGVATLEQADLITWQAEHDREVGLIRDTIDASQGGGIVAVDRVYGDDTTATASGTVKMHNWTLNGAGVIASTPARRVVDRLHLRWLEVLDRVTPKPTDGPIDFNGWPLSSEWSVDGSTSGPVVGAEYVYFLDWGVCYQEYRVVVRRVKETFINQRRDSIEFALQRINRGGDFIAACGMTNWGVSNQQVRLTGGTWPATYYRMRLPDDTAEMEGAWWKRYTYEEVFSAREKLRTLEGLTWVYYDNYFQFPTTRREDMPGLGVGEFRHPYDVFVRYNLLSDSIPWFTPDPAKPRVGREIDLYNNLYSNSPPERYPDFPSRVAFDFNRENIWYDVMTISQFGSRETWTDDAAVTVEETDGSGNIQVIVDESGTPFFDPSGGGDRVEGLAWADLGEVFGRFVNGDNLYNGAFGTLPAPFASTSRMEVFCGMEFDAAGAWAVDVVTHPDGGYLAVAVDLDWNTRVARGVTVDGGLSWTVTSVGSVNSLVPGGGEFDVTHPPVQEYSFAESGWPRALGRLRSKAAVIAFRAATKSSRPAGFTMPAVARVVGVDSSA